MAILPTPEEREFVAALNELSKDHSSAAFGDPGRMVISKARRQLAFASSAWMRWPDLGDGDLRTMPVDGWSMSKVDPSCSFWSEGQRRYLSALTSHLDVLRSLSIGIDAQRELLGNLGFHIVEDFVSEQEEAELVDYWRADGPVFPFGTDEQISGRRWFNYGPILPRATSGTTKSTLTVIPARLGEMPPSVSRQRLQERIREQAERLLGTRDHPAFARQYAFDQMYVNYYNSASRANIEFHHDNHTCMHGVVAGVSLMSSCELQLRALDKGSIQCPPLRVTLPRRSLFFLSGLSRWHLQHGIPRMTEDRLSLTFRTVDRSCSRQQELWGQGWDCLELEEAENAIWPLVRPDGAELHMLFPTAAHAAAVALAALKPPQAVTAGDSGDLSLSTDRGTVRRMPRRSTVLAKIVPDTPPQRTALSQVEKTCSLYGSSSVATAISVETSLPRSIPIDVTKTAGQISCTGAADAVSNSEEPHRTVTHGDAVRPACLGSGRLQGFYPERAAPSQALKPVALERRAGSYYGPLAGSLELHVQAWQ